MPMGLQRLKATKGQLPNHSIFVAGIDAGSLYTKAVILDIGWPQVSSLLSYSVVRSGIHYEKIARNVLEKALENCGLKIDDISYTIGTGYGRNRVPFADRQITEITCHAKGVNFLFPDVRTAIDIGGQDSKVIQVGEKGEVITFVMNAKCAAGTGRVLEVMAEALDTPLEKMAQTQYLSQSTVEISSMCTVFAESEVISLMVDGYSGADIITAIYRAIARRIMGMVGQVGIREKVAITGGGGKNIGLVHALQGKLNTEVLIPEEPQIVGALGAAIIAGQDARK